MNTKETTYKKEPVRLQLRQRAGWKQVVYLEFYKEGVRTYERIPDMVIVPETDQKAIKANQTVLAKAEKICRQRKREMLKAQKQQSLAVESEEQERKLSLMDWIGRYVEKPRDFDPFGQTGFAHLWLQYDCPFKVLVLGVNFILPF